MKNIIFKVVAVAAMMLSFAFSWVNSPAYAQVNPIVGKVVKDIAGDAKTGVNFSTLENRIEKLEARTQVLEKRNADADARYEKLEARTQVLEKRNADADAKAAALKVAKDQNAATERKLKEISGAVETAGDDVDEEMNSKSSDF